MRTSHLTQEARRLAIALARHQEWLCAEGAAGRTFSLRLDECDIQVQGARLLFSYFGDNGARVWSVLRVIDSGEGKLRLEVARRLNRERSVLELVPRLSHLVVRQTIIEARQMLCLRIAELARRALGENSKIESVRLSRGARRGEPGRYAHTLLQRGKEFIFVTAPVVELTSAEADLLLASALVRFARLNSRARPVARMWLIASPELARALAERCALLRESLSDGIEIYESDENFESLTSVSRLCLSELLEAEPKPLRPSRSRETAWAQRIAELAPEAIDVVRVRHGETLRFHGLAFARVRRVVGEEQVWFGVRGITDIRLLDETNFAAFLKLINKLKEHRRYDASDRAHALYRQVPEAWLESLLRRNVAQLDPGLILAPLHSQFRLAGHDEKSGARRAARPVDLLALRQDGRLAVIELKVSEDLTLPLQAADYWRRIEAERLCGNIQRAGLFGAKQIADSPPLVYLVAPLLRFHRQFEQLANSITPAIEIYRFDINEDWRAGVRVARRVRVN